MLLAGLNEKGITGRDASRALGEANITVNKNLIPFDDKSPAVTSGIRLGTAAVTTRGMKEAQIRRIAGFIDEAIEAGDDSRQLRRIKQKVLALTARYPLYPELARY